MFYNIMLPISIIYIETFIHAYFLIFSDGAHSRGQYTYSFTSSDMPSIEQARKATLYSGQLHFFIHSCSLIGE